MYNNSSISLTVTDYFLQNTAFYFKLLRISRRITVTEASAKTGLSEKAINDFEAADQKEGSINTLLRLSCFYGIAQLKTNYSNLPPQQDWKELKEKGRELGNEFRCKDIPKPGSGLAAREHDERWAKWGEGLLQKFYERVG